MAWNLKDKGWEYNYLVFTNFLQWRSRWPLIITGSFFARTFSDDADNALLTALDMARDTSPVLYLACSAFRLSVGA